MKVVCWVTKVDKENVEKLREFTSALEGARREEYVASERKLGIDREMWFLWDTPDQAYCVLFMQGDDLEKGLQGFQECPDAFETWGRDLLWEITDDWPKPIWAGPGEPGVLETLSAYDTDHEPLGN